MSNRVNRATNDLDHANSDEREATELQSYNQSANRNAASVTTAADDDFYSVRTNRLKRQCPESILDSIRSFWSRHVVVTVSREACRDHFGRSFFYLGRDWPLGRLWIYLGLHHFLLHTAVLIWGCLTTFCLSALRILLFEVEGLAELLHGSNSQIAICNSCSVFLICYSLSHALLSLLPYRMTLTGSVFTRSFGEDILRVLEDVISSLDARRHHRSTIPSSAQHEPRTHPWLLYGRSAARYCV